MSAILAVINKNGGEVAEHHFSAALAALRWRGRHRQVERLAHGWLGAVHPLPSAQGHQGADLARDADGNVAVCHGHLFDLPDLYRRLGKPLPADIDQRPARAVLDACLEWGRHAPEQWVGEASFIFWDQQRQELISGRDHLGTRPLFYYDHGGLVAFCTDSKALLTLGGRIPEPDPVSMHRFLCLDSWQDERSFFLRVKRVLPGRLKVLSGGKIKSVCYWKPGQEEAGTTGDQGDFRAEFREKVSRAIDRRIQGMDSFSLDPRRDEFHFLLAALLGKDESQRLNMPPAEASADAPAGVLVPSSPISRMTGDELLDEMDRMNIFHDEPVASLEVIRSWMLRNEGSVAATGVQLNQIGARDLLGHEELSLSFLLKAGRIRELARRIKEAGLTEAGGRKAFLAVLQHALGPLLPPSLLDTRRSFLHKERFPWLNSTLTRLPLERRTRLEGEFPTELHHRMAAAISHGTLPLKLHYEDRHAGILGLETRYPFLDIDVVRFCFSLPADRLYGEDSLGAAVKKASPQVVGAGAKPTLAQVMRRVFEKHWEDRGFQKRIAETLSRSQLVADGWLRADKLILLQDRVLAGNKELRPHLWRVLTLEGWYRQRWSAQAKSVQPPALRIASRTHLQSG